MELKTKTIILQDGRKFMGEGVLWLMEGIDETGSLLAAAKGMGLSYSKARTMMERLEKETGRCMIERKKGGAAHQGAELTSFAKEYISLYREFDDAVRKDAMERFSSFAEKVAKLSQEEEESNDGI